MAAIGAAALATAVAVAYFAGLKRVSSPGPVSTSHSPIEARCEQCHTVGRGVADVRCERCHDPGGADRFTQQGHVLLGSGNPHKAASAPAVACAACHTDHRGRATPVKHTDDRDCATCHEFSALKNHPEFAAVKAQISTGAGLSFGHQRHLAEAAKVGRKCEACHEPTADLVGFQPMTFDRHCAACHTKDGAVTGESEAVAPDVLTPAGDAAAGKPPTQTPAELGRIVLSQMKHKDPWVLYNAQRLRRMIDPMGISAESAALRAQIAYLTQQTTGQPLSSVDVAGLQTWQTTLTQDLKRIDEQLASKTSSGGDDAALTEMRTAVQQIARQLSAVDPEAKVLDADAQKAPAAAAPSGGDATGAKAFEARKGELLAILDAIAARGDKALIDRAAALRKQVESLQPGTGGGQADVAALSERLRGLDEVLGAVRATDDPQAQFVAGQIGALKSVAQAQINGGLSPDIFEDRRRELLTLLDAIERTGSPELTARAAVLRQRVLSLQPGSYGDAGLRDERARTVKLLERIAVEIELAKQGDSASAAASGRDAAQLQTTLAKLRTQLGALQSGGRPGTADTPADLRKATTALNNMLAPCLKCHVMDGARIAPVAADPKVFERSVFTHKPHVEHADCAACHKSVETSTKATDVNEPGVATCQSCHQPSKARADCAACHFYHPPSLARLVGAL